MKSFQRHLSCRQPSTQTWLPAASAIGRAVSPIVAKPKRTHAMQQRACWYSSSAKGCSNRKPIIRTANPGAPVSSIRAQHTLPARSVDKGRLLDKRPVARRPRIHTSFEPVTGTWQYVVADPVTLEAVIIDPVLDYDPATQMVTTTSADSLLALINEMNYHIARILETHAHADHLTAASYLQSRLAKQQEQKPLIGIGKRITQVQTLFGQKYGISPEEYEKVFDTLFEDDEAFDIGELEGIAMHLPGHTPDHLGYKIGDNVFCGDSIFHSDIGTARCDFPGGSANTLYQSSRRLLELPPHVKIWAGHDYPPEGRGDPVPFLTVAEHREQNKHISDGISEEDFVALRTARDMQLAEPRLLHQSLQINIRGGRMPSPTQAGLRLLHLPMKPRGLAWGKFRTNESMKPRSNSLKSFWAPSEAFCWALSALGVLDPCISPRTAAAGKPLAPQPSINQTASGHHNQSIMEALSVAANIVAIIQIADRVIDLCRYYLGSIHDAPSDLRLILLEASAVRTILDNIRFLKESGHAPGTLTDLDGAQGPIQGCRKAVSELEALLPRRPATDAGPQRKKTKVEAALKTIAWPLRQNKARRLLQELSEYKSTINTALTIELTRDLKDVKETAHRIEGGLTELQENAVYEWLRDIDPTSLHHKACSQYEQGTGNWILRSDAFGTWTSGKSRCIWIHGIPGAGKTILLSHLYDEAEKHNRQRASQHICVYYYCYFGHDKDEAAPFLKWIISQVCRTTTMPRAVFELYRRGRQPSISELLEVVEGILRDVRRLDIYLDALDESTPRTNLLRVVRDLVTDARFHKVFLLASSREYVEIEDVMSEISLKISMKNHLLDDDINLYIRAKLSSHPVLQHWPAQIQTDIYHTLSKKAQGMFRWVVCQLDVLCRLRCDAGIIKSALSSLPQTLDETYERVFCAIPRDAISSVLLVLKSIFCAGELPWSRLDQILCYSSHRPGKETFPCLYTTEAIIDLCGCLVTVHPGDDSTSKVSIAHYTVWEYVVSPRILEARAKSFYVDEETATVEWWNFILAVLTDDNPAVDHVPARHDVGNASQRNFVSLYDWCALYFEGAFLMVRHFLPYSADSDRNKLSAQLIGEFLDASGSPLERFIDHMHTHYKSRLELSFECCIYRYISGSLELLTFYNLLAFYNCIDDSFPPWTLFFPNHTDDIGVFSAPVEILLPLRYPEKGPSGPWAKVSGTILDIHAYHVFGGCYAPVGDWMSLIPSYADLTTMVRIATGRHSSRHCTEIGGHPNDICHDFEKLVIHAKALPGDTAVTPLQMAVARRDPTAVKLFLRAGADPNATGECTAMLSEQGSFLALFDHLHGLSPLYILYNMEAMTEVPAWLQEEDDDEEEDNEKEDFETGVEGRIEHYLLESGALELKAHCRTSNTGQQIPPDPAGGDDIAPPPRPPPFLRPHDAAYLAHQGHLNVHLPPHLQDLYDRLFALCDEFFRQPDEEKARPYPCTAPSPAEQGYCRLEGEKQYITLRHLYGPVSDASSPLNKTVSEVWRETVAFLNRVLGDISDLLGISPTAWEDQIIDSRVLPSSKEDSSPSMMRLFRYEPETGIADPHRDLGLLTLCVCRGRGLQVWDRDVVLAKTDAELSSMSEEEKAAFIEAERARFWKDAGASALLAGDSLRVLSGNRITAGMHRVVGTEAGRDSMVFALRATSKGTIDLEKFGGFGTVDAKALWHGISHNRFNVNLRQDVRDSLRQKYKASSQAIA
ncbi:uncharacterized protein E0L32_002558 [Thyridium curvatum]|uniref:NACHT domain-containing protein n=1 Tax=Thyridium curvatum TaxID=1093900 RepID=A0A507BN93_9PEZI|nr:uncharacterized protein E0L32_002558 [Thyridium curvatum]TPX18701.1 hypothetical protein E0L32_002558 [Thyridium curvatum]